MAEGYEDIDRLVQNQNAMLDNSLQQQNDIINKQTDMNVAEIERNKQKLDEDTNKINKALYTEYQKQVNPYGANAERLASQGLLNSGYAETTKANLYNTYQKNVTDTLNNARTLKADFDNEITKARQTGDLTKAQNALELYKQKMQLLTQEYELKNDREKYLYQKSQDALQQSNWEKEYQRQLDQYREQFEYQRQRDAESDRQYREQFDYQKSRDSVADNQWQKQYELSKKASASSSSSRRRSSSGSSRNYGTSSVAKTSPADSVNTSNSTSNNSGKNSNNQDSTLKNTMNKFFTATAEKIINTTKPNTQIRQVQLQNLVKAGALTQGQANQLLGAS